MFIHLLTVFTYLRMKVLGYYKDGENQKREIFEMQREKES